MKLSALELEVLQYICKAGSTTAPEVHKEIAKLRHTTYSTIKTVFDRLEKKGAIHRESSVGRTSIYGAMVSDESVQVSLLHDFMGKFFPTDKTILFNTLIRDSKLNDDDILYLKQLLEEKNR